MKGEGIELIGTSLRFSLGGHSDSTISANALRSKLLTSPLLSFFRPAQICMC